MAVPPLLAALLLSFPCGAGAADGDTTAENPADTTAGDAGGDTTAENPADTTAGDAGGDAAPAPATPTRQEIIARIADDLAGDADPLLDAAARILAAAEAERASTAEAGPAGGRRSEPLYFGVRAHIFDPPYDYYRDPVKSVHRASLLHIDRIDPQDFDIPIVVNERVQDWMVYFLTRGRKHFAKWLGRKPRYEPFIVSQLDERDLPRDLLYQSMIESGFSPYAYSWAKAAGIWQFIPSTGRRYGMKINWWVDQRRDPYEATRAALDYLEYLYGMFGDWQLASAAYNAGEGKIGRAIERYETRNFWELCQGDYLKPETKDYVPKIIAAAILSKYAERYGLVDDVPEWFEPWEFEMVTVPEATDVGVIAEITGSSEDDLLEMNPSLRRWCTPPDEDDYEVRIPAGSAEGFHEKLAAIPEEERLTFKRHRVRSGETLSKIATSYGVGIDAILKMNTIRNPNRISVGQYLVIPVRATPKAARDIVHTVQRGDTLSAIAQRYGVTMRQLRELNGIHGDTIRPGDRLVVQRAPRPAPADTAEGNAGDAVAAAGEAAEEAGAGGTEARAPDDAERAATPGDDDAAADAGGGGAPAAGGNEDPAGVAEDGAVAEDPAGEARTLAQLVRARMERVAGAGGAEAAVASAIGPPEPRRDDAVAPTADRGDAPAPPATTAGGADGTADAPDAAGDGTGAEAPAEEQAAESSTDAVAEAEPERTRGEKLVHEVRRGQTLSHIAATYDVSVSAIKRWNSLHGDTIWVGQELTLYPGPESAIKKLVHEVRSGDTLWEIAHAHGVAVADLQKWNHLGSRSTIRVGQRLTIYSGAGAGAAASRGPRTVTHRVARGETLWDIARQYGVSVDAIKSWNDLGTDRLLPGQKLTLKL